MSKIKLAAHAREDTQNILNNRSNEIREDVSGNIRATCSNGLFETVVYKFTQNQQARGYSNGVLVLIMQELKEKGYKIAEFNDHWLVSWKE